MTDFLHNSSFMDSSFPLLSLFLFLSQLSVLLFHSSVPHLSLSHGGVVSPVSQPRLSPISPGVSSSPPVQVWSRACPVTAQTLPR